MDIIDSKKGVRITTMTEKIKRVNVDVPEDLWNQVTIQAAKETIEAGVKVDKREIVIKALEGYLMRSKGE